MNNDGIAIGLFLFKALSNKPNPEFHHISLKTQLKDTEDYKRLRWIYTFIKNKAKILENHISRHRTYNIVVYPSGTVMMTIKTSKAPFGWDSHDDWMNLIALCGSIHQIFKDNLSVSEPLIHTSELDWVVTQLDIDMIFLVPFIDKSRLPKALCQYHDCLMDV